MKVYLARVFYADKSHEEIIGVSPTPEGALAMLGQRWVDEGSISLQAEVQEFEMADPPRPSLSYQPGVRGAE